VEAVEAVEAVAPVHPVAVSHRPAREGPHGQRPTAMAGTATSEAAALAAEMRRAPLGPHPCAVVRARGGSDERVAGHPRSRALSQRRAGADHARAEHGHEGHDEKDPLGHDG
jgi:hypothetical protein